MPTQATPGDHTGAMVAAVGVTRKNAAGENVVENYRIAVPLELRVPGALHAGIQVQSISTGFSDPLNPFGTGSATVSYTMTNTGNVRQSATPTVKITGPFGQSATVHPAKVPVILPGDSVRVTANVSGLFPAGPMTAHVDVASGWPKGTIPLAQSAPEATGNAPLFAFPWSLLGLILLLVAIGVGIWFYLRWRRRLRRAELASVAARASRDTERRLLGGRAAANGHSANGHSVNGHRSTATAPSRRRQRRPSPRRPRPAPRRRRRRPGRDTGRRWVGHRGHDRVMALRLGNRQPTRADPPGGSMTAVREPAAGPAAPPPSAAKAQGEAAGGGARATAAPQGVTGAARR